jgi:GH18 family chitinase
VSLHIKNTIETLLFSKVNSHLDSVWQTTYFHFRLGEICTELRSVIYKENWISWDSRQYYDIKNITDFMEHRSYSNSTYQEIPHLSWNVKTHYCVWKYPPLSPVLNQLHTVHNLTPNAPIWISVGCWPNKRWVEQR